VPTTPSRSELEVESRAEEATDLTYAALAATMELTRLRSLMRVGIALVTRFPEEQDWWVVISEPEYVQSLNALAEVINDVRNDPAVMESPTPESVASAADRHYERAVESIEVVADRLGVPVDDLLSVLIDP